MDELNKKIVGDEIPEITVNFSLIKPEKPVNSPMDGSNKEEIVNDVIPEIPINSSIINIEMPVNSPMDGLIEKEIEHDVIPQIPINSSVNNPLSENKIIIDEKKGACEFSR